MTPPPSFTFWKSCPQLVGDEVRRQGLMIAQAQDISYRSFRKAVGGKELDAWAKDPGYDTGTERGGLRLSKDWHVAYYRSTWGRKPCYYLVWSAMEMIWRSDV